MAAVAFVYIQNAHRDVVLIALQVEGDVFVAPFIVLNNSGLCHIILPPETLQISQHQAALIIVTTKIYLTYAYIL